VVFGMSNSYHEYTLCSDYEIFIVPFLTFLSGLLYVVKRPPATLQRPCASARVLIEPGSYLLSCINAKALRHYLQEIKVREEAFQASEARYRSLAKQAPTLSLVLDAPGRYVFLNPRVKISSATGPMSPSAGILRTSLPLNHSPRPWLSSERKPPLLPCP
jgi:PAS domain-containing protein